MEYIIGINAYHGDSSACILGNGQLIAAAEEERFRRIKHWAGFPSESIKYCLEEAGLKLSDIDCIAINRLSKANIFRKFHFAVRHRPDFRMILNRLKNAGQIAGVPAEIDALSGGRGFAGRIHYIEHHVAHLASAYYASPYPTASVVSVDGFGDFASTAWGRGEAGSLRLEDRVFFPHSLGIMFQAITQYLGFPEYGDEYKVMGLASYGRPVQVKAFESVVQLKPGGRFELNTEYFRHADKRVDYEWNGGSPKVGQLWAPELESLLGRARQPSEPIEQRHMDIAHSLQMTYEKALFNLLDALHACHDTDNLCLAGGCAMNSVANGKVALNTPYKHVYVQPAAGDAGGSIGAAYQVWAEASEKHTLRYPMEHAYWGPSYSNDYICLMLGKNAERLTALDCTYEQYSEEDLYDRTASAIANGLITGWFQGRMEWGARALGNRSILCDPRRMDMKGILNRKIKRRESFRPFAPSVLRDNVIDWFEQDDDVPFMLKVLKIREDRRKEIPAVTHVDGTGRLQTVSRCANPRYYRLIECFYRRTGVPLVLNTSFNENEPVVCRPEEALECFLRTNMDVLVIGNWILERRQE